MQSRRNEDKSLCFSETKFRCPLLLKRKWVQGGVFVGTGHALRDLMRGFLLKILTGRIIYVTVLYER